MPTTTGGFCPDNPSTAPIPPENAAAELAQARQHFFLPRMRQKLAVV
jgi:hypothetical protein